jgi:hypothetical protein
VESTGRQHLVFVVVGDGDQQLGVSVIHGWTQVVTVVEGEVVGIAGRGGV